MLAYIIRIGMHLSAETHATGNICIPLGMHLYGMPHFLPKDAFLTECRVFRVSRFLPKDASLRDAVFSVCVAFSTERRIPTGRRVFRVCRFFYRKTHPYGTPGFMCIPRFATDIASLRDICVAVFYYYTLKKATNYTNLHEFYFVQIRVNSCN